MDLGDLLIDLYCIILLGSLLLEVLLLPLAEPGACRRLGDKKTNGTPCICNKLNNTLIKQPKQGEMRLQVRKRCRIEWRMFGEH
ncbi:hypothetical protein ACET3Z_028318 [Daucus carota]